MRYRQLGRTGILVSEVAFGSLTMAPMQANLPPEAAAEVLCHASERGVNFLDTAQLYENYEYIRLAEKRMKRPLVIASKAYAYEKQMAFDAVEQARRALDRDYIDLFLLHEQESEHTLRGHMPAIEELLRLKALGVIRAFGISTHHVAAVRAAAAVDYIDVVHPLINKAGLGIVDGTRADMEQAMREAYEKGIGLYTMKSLGGGNLFSSAEESFRYIFSFPYKHAVCIGMQSCDEVDADIDFAEKGCFSEESLRRLSQKKRHLHIDDWCVGCGRCVQRCRQHALSVVNGKAAVTGDCVLCGYCSRVCDQWAIKVV